MMAVLKSLSDNPNISVIQVLALSTFYHLVWDLPGSWKPDWFSTETWTLWVLYYETLGLI